MGKHFGKLGAHAATVFLSCLKSRSQLRCLILSRHFARMSYVFYQGVAPSSLSLPAVLEMLGVGVGGGGCG